jgi:capsular polysaccharide transport system permease protein
LGKILAIRPRQSFISRSISSVVRVNRLFLVCVVTPVLLSIIYFGFIASDVYISESRFVVRSPQRQIPTGLTSLLQGGGFSRSQDEAFSVQEFMLSRDALQELNAKLSVAKIFSNPAVDRISRFAGIDPDDSFEALHRYYQKRVSINFDAASSILALRVSAFSAEDAYKMDMMLLELGEDFINQLNVRSRQDTIRFAASEVEAAKEKAKAAALALTEYRNSKAVFDPDRQSALQLQQISKIQDELIANKTQLAQLIMLTPDNPQISALRKRLETLQAAMDAEMAKVTGVQSSLANKAAEYERLTLERGFADKQLGLTLASLEEASNDAQRKQLYLERVVRPNRPDVAVEPHRVKAIFSTLAVSFIVWGIMIILLAGIREHQDS